MTLSEWEAKFNKQAINHKNGLVYLPDDFLKGRADLWRLSDHWVVSVRGGSIWLSSYDGMPSKSVARRLAYLASENVGAKP